MNAFTIVVLLVLAAFALNGWRRGFVRVCTHMFFFLGSSVLVYFMTPYISDALKEYTPVYALIEEGCRDMIGEGAAGQEDSKLGQKQFLEGLGLPEILEKQLIGGNNKDRRGELGSTDFTDYLAGYLAGLILNILTFVVPLVIVHLILRMTICTLNNLSKLPVLHSVNKTLGMVCGLAQGLLAVWLAFLVITAFSSTETGRKLMAMIHESPVLEFLYNMNIFLEYLLQIVSGK